MIIRTTCAFDCPDCCSVLCERDESVSVRLSGDPQHPLTRGLLCRKIRRHPARLSAGERIRHPWIRADGRHGEFLPASWDEALEAASAALVRARDEDPASILSLRSAGSMGAGKSFADYIFGLLSARWWSPRSPIFSARAKPRWSRPEGVAGTRPTPSSNTWRTS